jgi:NAD(P)-dependent dehydrogenase (short-subunit alcohol dehydrogenase family)
VCEALGQRGVGVLCVDREQQLADKALKAVVAAGGIGKARVADVSIEGDVLSYASACQELWGNANFFFNNAGIEGVDAPLASYPVEAWDRVMAVNLRGVFLGLKAMYPLLRHGETPRIVNTASVAGMIATPMIAAYGASKHAVIGLTKTAAVEFAAQGIAVNALCPGPVESQMMRRIERGLGDAQAAKSQYEAMIPASRYATLEEVAAMAVFLLLDSPMYLTGQAIALDGGLSIS